MTPRHLNNSPQFFPSLVPRILFCASVACCALLSTSGAFAQEGNVVNVQSSADPLAWLDSDLACEELVSEIKKRYGSLGKYSEMPIVKREELKEVLDVSCSERFEHCGFKSCQKLTMKSDSVPSAAA